MSRIVVRGRDFTAYRIGGAIAAVLLGLALIWQTIELFDGDALTVPESRWGAVQTDNVGTADAEQSSIMASEILSARTRLQDERYRTGPSPDAEAPDLATGQGEFLVEQPMDDGETLTRAWLQADEDELAMLKPREEVIGISSLPYANAELFERPTARNWRLSIADFATHMGALAILGFAFLLAAILALRGRVPIAEGRSGRTVKRFSFVERANHWMTALSFIGLALTGVVLAFGKTLLMPFGEYTLGDFGWVSTWGHVMFGPSFFLGICVMAVLWTWRNLPSRLDLTWLARGGGFFSDDPDNPPARKFNAGQKLIFWSAVLGGLLMVATGVTLMFPYYWLDLGQMSWAMLIHAVIGLLLIAFFIGHIYIGTVGMQGAFWAMWDGEVDWNWASEHHDLWLAEIAGTSEPLPPMAEPTPPPPGPRPSPARA